MQLLWYLGDLSNPNEPAYLRLQLHWLGIGYPATVTWLGVAFTTLACEETTAAEAPATNRLRAKARTKSFMTVFPLFESKSLKSCIEADKEEHILVMLTFMRNTEYYPSIQ